MSWKELKFKMSIAGTVVSAWLGMDGMLHILVSTLLMVAFGWMPVYYAAAVTLIIGMGKEVYDLVKVEKIDRALVRNVLHDLLCDLIGIGCGYIIILINSLG